MNNRYLQGLLMALYATLALSLSSCVKNPDDIDPMGDMISFGAATGYENDIQTRTEYSGLDENTALISSSSQYERIDWVENNDRVRILCAQAVDQNGDPNTSGTWIVGAPTASGANSSAEITAAPGTSAFFWGRGAHYFYALYPAAGTVSNYDSEAVVTESESKIEALTGNKAKITGTIPSAQTCVKVDTVFKPNMNFAYMYAAEKMTRPADGSVSLNFKPLVTAFQFSLKALDTRMAGADLLTLKLSSTSSDMTGGFTATLDKDGDTLVDFATTGTPGNEITVTLPANTRLSQDHYSVITVLALGLEQTNLTLTLTFDGGLTRSLALTKTVSGTTEPITVGACKKVYIKLGVPGPSDGWVYTLTEVDTEGNPIAVTDIKAGEVPTGHGGHIGHYPVQTRTKLFQSYKTQTTGEHAGDKALVDVKIEFAAADEDGNMTGEWDEANIPDWLSDYSVTDQPETTAPTGTWTSEADYTELPIKVLNPGQSGLDQYETFNEIKVHTTILRGRSANGFTSDAPQDLALYDIDKLTATTANSHPKTANCYVVDRKGWYQFPLVYGNAIDWDHSPDNNGWNPSSVKDNDSGLTGIQTYRLPHFQNFIGKPIRSPYIMDDINSTESATGLTVNDVEAVIVWEDASVPFISNSSVQLVSAPTTDAVYYAVDGTTEKTIPYIKFQVNDNIMQGNALLALREKEGAKRIIWSWHIWITDLDMGTVNVPLHSGSVVSSNDMMLYNLGWCDMRIGRMYSYVPRICYARISQTEAGSTAAPLVFKITEKLDPYYTLTLSSGTYYQMGRKDPFFSGTTNEGLTWGDNVTTQPQYGNSELSVEPHTSGTVPPLYINKPVYDPNTFGVTSSATSIPSPEVTEAQNDMVHTIQNPHRFFSRSVTSTIGWLYDRRPYNLWNMYNYSRGYNNGNLEYYYSGGLEWYSPHYEYDQIVVKTVYDPCPPGFSVPNYTGFTGFTDTGYNVAYRDGSGSHSSGAKWVPEDAETFPDIELYGDYRYYFDTNDGSRTICFPSHGYRNSDLNDSPVAGLFGGVYYMTAQKKGDRYVVCLSGYGPMGAANGRSIGYAVRAIKEQPRN